MYSEASNNGEVLHVKGVTRQECLEKIRDMHGTDFIILNQARKLTSGFCGFFQKDVYEVTYQLKPKPVKPQANDVSGRFGSFTNMSQPVFPSSRVPSVADAFVIREKMVL